VSQKLGNVPKKWPENHLLGVWVNEQRKEKRAKDTGKPSKLNDEKLELLEKAGFVWLKESYQSKWDENFIQLLEYFRNNGHCKMS
jgi:hypothetical protein